MHVLTDGEAAVNFNGGVVGDQGPGGGAEAALAEGVAILDPHDAAVDLPGPSEVVGSRENHGAATILHHGTRPADLGGEAGAGIRASQRQAVGTQVHPAAKAAAAGEGAYGFASVNPEQRARVVRQRDRA